MFQNKQEKTAVLDNALVKEDCGGADYNNQDDWKIRGIMVGLKCLHRFPVRNVGLLGFFLCSILILDKLEIYH